MNSGQVVARLDDVTPANMTLQLHMNVSLNRPPDRTWHRLPGRHRTSGSTSYETIRPVRLESSGDVLSVRIVKYDKTSRVAYIRKEATASDI